MLSRQNSYYISGDSPAARQSRRALGESGAVPPLVENLKSASLRQQTQAATVLGYLALDAENKLLIGAAGAIPVLVELLNLGVGEEADPCDRVTQLPAVAALANLAADNSMNAASIASAGGLAPILWLAYNADSLVARNYAAMALCSLALECDVGVEAEIVGSGGVQIIVALLASGDPHGRQLADKALNSIAHDDCNRQAIVVAQQRHAEDGKLEAGAGRCFDDGL